MYDHKEQLRFQIALFAMFLIGALFGATLLSVGIDDGTKDEKNGEKNGERVEANNAEERIVDRYTIGDLTFDLEGFDTEPIELEDTLSLSSPSTILISSDFIEGGGSESDAELYKELLYRGHFVLFVGVGLNPENVVSLYDEESISVVPIKSPQATTYFHSYGSLINREFNKPIPVFFASTNKDSIDAKSLLTEIDKVERAYLLEQIPKAD